VSNFKTYNQKMDIPQENILLNHLLVISVQTLIRSELPKYIKQNFIFQIFSFFVLNYVCN